MRDCFESFFKFNFQNLTNKKHVAFILKEKTGPEELAAH